MTIIEHNESKLRALGLWVSLPINLQLLLTQSERDVLNAIRHLINIGERFASLSLLRLYTGLSKRAIQDSIKSLLALGVISKGATCKKGTDYKVLYTGLGTAIATLNKEKNAVERLRLADKLRGIGRARFEGLIQEYENTEFDS